MDAEEAAAMIKSLQATSIKAEAEMRAKGASARSMRAKAARRAALATAPLEVVEEGSEEAHDSPPAAAGGPNGDGTSSAKDQTGEKKPKSDRTRKAKGAKQAPKSSSKAAVASPASATEAGASATSSATSAATEPDATPASSSRQQPRANAAPTQAAPSASFSAALGRGMDAASAAIGGLLSERAAAIGGLFSERSRRTAEAKPAMSAELRAELTTQFVSKMRHVLASCAFDKWRTEVMREREALKALRSTLAAFRNPFVLRGFSTWKQGRADVLERRRVHALARAHLHRTTAASGFAAFSRVFAHVRKGRELNARCETVKRHLILPRMRGPFNVWHEQQLHTEFERKLKDGLCCALGYWLRTSCGRCACRDIIVPLDTQRKMRADGVWWV
jgi:hypothetical protein